MKKELTLLCIALGFATAGMAQSTSVAAYTTNTLECLGTELDGSQTIRVSGIGRTRADSREQCRKNAVWAVIFKGVTGGIGNCNMRALINEPNAEEKYEDYFNAFFADNGPWKKFVSMKDRRIMTSNYSRTDAQVLAQVTVTVFRADLKAKLQADGIIPQ